MKRLSLLALVFTVLSVVFFLLLIFFRTPFPLYPLMSYQDAFDLLTPLVLIPIYWRMFRLTGKDGTDWAGEIAFMVLAGLWVMGQGMHLSANSVNNLSESLARKQVIDITKTNIYTLTYFFDEHLSHYLWHAGIAGLAALLIFREWRRPSEQVTIWWATIVSGFLYGFTCFCTFLEGQTVWLGLPFSLAVTLITLIWGRQKLGQRPLATFFFFAFLVTFLFLAGWGLYWGGFPQFSEVGLI